MKHYSTTGRRNHGRPLKRLLDVWDGNGPTIGQTVWQIYDDDDDGDNDYWLYILFIKIRGTLIQIRPHFFPRYIFKLIVSVKIFIDL